MLFMKTYSSYKPEQQSATSFVEDSPLFLIRFRCDQVLGHLKGDPLYTGSEEIKKINTGYSILMYLPWLVAI